MTRSIPTQKKRSKSQQLAALKAAKTRPGGGCQDVLDRVAAIAATRPMPKPMPENREMLHICSVPAPLMLANPVDIYIAWLRVCAPPPTAQSVEEVLRPWFRYYGGLYGARW